MTSCMEAGTHSSIKYYQYNVSKQDLEKALQHVIISSNTIHQDRMKDYYNDDTTYVTINIAYGKIFNNYIFRYGGNKDYWDTSKKSSISIAYAHNKDGEGGSAGNGGVEWYNYKLKAELVEPFEKELISKIDNELGMKHIDSE